MKNMKKIVAMILATAMVMAMSMVGFAAEATTGSITITPPTNTAADAQNSYKIYKVFDAVASEAGVSYKVMASKADKELPTGFVTDAAGNVIHGTKNAETGEVTPIEADELTAAEIASIAAYVAGDTAVATATSTGTATATAEGLANGYYYITTSTGSVVTIDTTRPNAEVNDKNTVPTLDKKAKQAEDPEYTEIDEEGKKAIAQVGKVIPFEATITVGKGAKDYVFHDVMSAGLTYNNDVTVTPAGAVFEDTLAEGDTITLKFDNDWIATLKEGDKITITYSATVTSDALSVNKATNTAKLTYGDANSNNHTPDSTVEVYNAKFTVTKKDGTGTALAGAGFVIKNADGKYYKLATDKKSVTWVDSIDDATEYTSDDQGAVPAFTGLGNGTYTLVEKTVPAGYNKAADKSFEIKGDDYTTANLVQTAEVVNESGAELPSTGGIGTTMFYIVGSVLVIGAAVVLISKRRMAR